MIVYKKNKTTTTTTQYDSCVTSITDYSREVITTTSTHQHLQYILEQLELLLDSLKTAAVLEC